MFLIKLAFLPFRILFGTASLGLRMGFGTGRMIGYGRIFAFGTGVAVGVLAASPEARERALELYRSARGLAAPSEDADLRVTV